MNESAVRRERKRCVKVSRGDYILVDHPNIKQEIRTDNQQEKVRGSQQCYAGKE